MKEVVKEGRMTVQEGKEKELSKGRDNGDISLSGTWPVQVEVCIVRAYF